MLLTEVTHQPDPGGHLVGGVKGYKQFSWLSEVGCGVPMAVECAGSRCDRCRVGVGAVLGAHRQDARSALVGDQP